MTMVCAHPAEALSTLKSGDIRPACGSCNSEDGGRMAHGRPRRVTA